MAVTSPRSAARCHECGSGPWPGRPDELGVLGAAVRRTPSRAFSPPIESEGDMSEWTFIGRCATVAP